jgi:hypothetical protein
VRQQAKPEVQFKAKEAASVISPLNMISILLLGCVMGQPDDVMPDARVCIVCGSGTKVNLELLEKIASLPEDGQCLGRNGTVERKRQER